MMRGLRPVARRRARAPARARGRAGLLGLAWVLLAGSAAVAMAAPARADALDEVRRRGVLRVGVKADMPAWGWRDPSSGRITGLEPDLAADLARRLRVRLELVGLETEAKVRAVQAGEVDLALATMADTPERRAQVALVLPHYYASGTGVLAHRQQGFRTWEDLRHRRVCTRRGSTFNRAVMVTHGVDLVALYSHTRALAALRDGRCDALLFDDVGIRAMLQQPAWRQAYEMALPVRFNTGWAIALPRQAAGSPLEAAVSRAVVDWHRSGQLLALERRWDLPASAFAVRMNAQWQRRTAGGGWYCGEGLSPATPPDCL